MSRKLLLSVEDVSKTYDGFRAINQLNFYLDEGELRTVIGPNGAGKSTFFDLLSGRAKPDIGKVEFGDIDLTKLDECTINQLGIGRKFQAPSVYVQLTVWDNIRLSLKGPRSVWSSLSRRLRSPTASTRFSASSASTERRACSPASSPTAKSSGWRSACCSRRSRNCCSWMNPPPA